MMKSTIGKKMNKGAAPNWRENGVRVVHADQRDGNTPQSPGMQREAGINAAVGANKIWAGAVTVQPNAKTGPHHHGPLESIIYVVSGRARFRWGEKLEFVAEAGPGDFVFVPPYVPHQELNASAEEPVFAVVTRSGQEPVVVNLEMETVEKPEEVYWVDPLHPAPA